MDSVERKNVSKHIKLDGVYNTRDIGIMFTADGRKIKSGCFYRSGSLEDASDDDLKWLDNHVDTVVDFRSELEVFEMPDRCPDRINYIHIPANRKTVDGITREQQQTRTLMQRYGHYTADEAKKYMMKVYHNFVDDDFVDAAYAKYIDILADRESGRILVHCAAGKDRAGFASIIIQEILGVKREDIIDDYMLSNFYNEENVAEMVMQIPEAERDRLEGIMRPFFIAYPEYIEELYSHIEEKYVSFSAFARERLGLTDEKREIIRRRFLE